ncbi:MAG: flippase-like domain-containing protein [Chloroflexi bacterium]|nr:flippase-like domain-containing protein [Chloroflexota bacterium]
MSVRSSHQSRNLVASLLISLAALAAALWGVQPARLLAALRAAHYVYLLPAGLMVFLGLLARARSWQILLGDGVPVRRTFWALNAGYLLNNLLPFRLGEVGRAVLVSRGEQVSASAALSSVVVERLIDVAVSLTGLLAALPFALAADWAPRVAWLAGGVALVLFVGLYLAARFRPWIVARLARVLARLPARLRGLARMADSFLRGLEVLRDPRRLAGAAFWSTLAWLTAWGQVWCVQRAFGVEGWATALFVLGVSAFGNAVPSSPGAVGVFELSVKAGLLAFGVPDATALSVALASHALVLAVPGAFGAVALAREGQSPAGIAASARRVLARTAVERS